MTAQRNLTSQRSMTTPRPGGAAALALVLMFALALTGCGGDDDGNPAAPGGGGGGQEFDVELAPVADATIDAANGDQSYGFDDHLETGSSRSFLLRFDLSALSEDAVITGARLELTQTAAGGAQEAATVTVEWIADDSWDEDVTADDDPGGTRETLGSFSLEALADGDRPATFAADLLRGKAASEQLYLDRQIGLSIDSATPLRFHARSAADPDARPRLALDHADGTRIELTASEDAFGWSRYPDSTLATVDSLVVDRTSAYTYVKFDLGALPDGAQLHFAGLEMRAFIGHAHGGDGNVYAMLVPDDTWSATTLTHDSRPAAVGDRLGHWWIWYNQNNGPADQQGRNHSPLLRPAIQQELDGDGVISLRLNSPGYRTVYYRNDAEDPEARPRLILVYTG